MKRTRTLRQEAVSPKTGMTLGEIAVFVQTAGVEPGAIHERVKIRTMWRGTIRSLQITFHDDEN